MTKLAVDDIGRYNFPAEDNSVKFEELELENSIKSIVNNDNLM